MDINLNYRDEFIELVKISIKKVKNRKKLLFNLKIFYFFCTR